jgi:hypothetical protein
MESIQGVNNGFSFFGNFDEDEIASFGCNEEGLVDLIDENVTENLVVLNM